MTPRLRVSSGMQRAALVAVLVALVGTVQALASAQRAPAPAATSPDHQDHHVNADAAALQEFQKRLEAYLDLRESLSHTVKPLSTTADAAELTTRQEALAAAMKAARKDARQGDLVPKAVADQIAAIVTADRDRRSAREARAELQEVPELASPAINKTYPASEPLATVPPMLLAQLPKLPDNLQYRFYGRHVVLLDGDLEIIVDYIANVLPSH